MKKKSLDWFIIASALFLLLATAAVIMDGVYGDAVVGKEWWVALILGVLYIAVFTKPFGYVFDEDKLVLYYVFGIRQTVLWDNVYAVKRQPFLRDWRYYKLYRTVSPKIGLSPKVRVNRKNKQLLDEFWKENV